MSDMLKEIDEFRKKAKLFAESYFASIKEDPYLFEAEDEQSQKKSTRKQSAAANAEFTKWRKEHPNASKEEVLKHKKFIAKQANVRPVDIRLEPEKEAPARSEKDLTPEEKAERASKAKASREEFEANLKKMSAPKSKEKPAEAGHEKLKKIPYGKSGMEINTSQPLRKLAAEFRAKHPGASAEQVSNYLDNVKWMKRQQAEERDKETKRSELGFNLPKGHEEARERVIKKVGPKSLRKAELGARTSQSAIANLIPFAKQLMMKYRMAKQQMAEWGSSHPVTSEDEHVVKIVEDLMGMPPLDPRSEESRKKFLETQAHFFSNPGKFLPTQFTQSSLRAYPEAMVRDVQDTLGKEGLESPDFESFMNKIKDLGPNAKARAIKNFKIGKAQNVSGNQIGQYLSKMPLSDIENLFSYFKAHPSEIAQAERSYRTPEFAAGKGGFKGLVVGDREPEERIEDVNAEPEESISPEDEDIVKKHIAPEAFGEEPVGEGEEEGGDFNVKDVFNQAMMQNKLEPKYFKIMQAKNVLGDYFKNYEDLMKNAEDVGELGSSEKLDLASRFLDQILDNQEVAPLVINALSRQYAMTIISDEVNRVLTAQSYDKQPAEKQKQILVGLMRKFRPEAFYRLAKAQAPMIKSALGQMLHTAKDGRTTLLNPRTVTWPDQKLQKVANTVFSKLSPNILANNLLGAKGEGTPFENFVMNKSDQVQRRILNVIRAVGNKHLIGQQKAEIESAAKTTPSEEALKASHEEKLRKRELRGEREQELMRARARGIHGLPGGLESDPEKKILNIKPEASPHVPEMWGEHPAQIRNAVAQFRRENPGASREEIAQFMAAARAMMKKEALELEIAANLMVEDKEVNVKNIRNYLVKSIKEGTISANTLREVLFDINGEIHSTAREDNWEEVNKSPKKKKSRGN